MNLGQRIRKLRRDRKWSQEELGKRMGITQPAVTQLEKGLVSKPRHLAEAAKAFGISIDDLMSGVQVEGRHDVMDLPLMGEVQAGHWREAMEFDHEDQIMIPVYVNGISSAEKMFLLRARGDSMNLAGAPDGTLLICMGIHDFSKFWKIQTGDMIIADRTDGAGNYESTVKELEIMENGEHWLWPRSSNPKFQTPIKVPPASEWTGGGEVSIRAVVVGQHSLNRFSTREK